ncbi:MAG: hypothetical protein KAW91_00215, partial [candidate division Zixibacteria bacterium]|nr:hypothetical protein [candidate division Zixibacteria bacterium]
LEEAVAELKGGEIVRLPEVKLELDMEVHISDRYVNDRRQKVDIYRRFADCRNLDDVERIRDEISDRFGHPPQSAANLIEAAAVKISAAMLEVERVRLKKGVADLFFKEGRALQRSEVEAFRRATDQRLEFSLVGRAHVTIDLGQIAENDRLSYLRGVLGKI